MDLDTISDFKLVTRAIREEWPISQEMRAAVIEMAYVRATSENAEVADKAAKLLLTADLVNQKRRAEEQKKIDKEHARKLQLIELAVKLGLTGNVGGGSGSVDMQQASIADT